MLGNGNKNMLWLCVACVTMYHSKLPCVVETSVEKCIFVSVNKC